MEKKPKRDRTDAAEPCSPKCPECGLDVAAGAIRCPRCHALLIRGCTGSCASCHAAAGCAAKKG